LAAASKGQPIFPGLAPADQAPVGRTLAVQDKATSLELSERFAIVDHAAPINYVSREEFELLKKDNPRLIEMRAGDIVYLTEPPSKR
jgi:hypothetical protein